ncbi:MAG: hypothetical protein R3F17_13160 [Planctomycetota bacterium]
MTDDRGENMPLAAAGAVVCAPGPEGTRVALVDRDGRRALPRVPLVRGEAPARGAVRAGRSQLGLELADAEPVFLATLESEVAGRRVRSTYWRVISPAADLPVGCIWWPLEQAARWLHFPEERTLIAAMQDPLAAPLKAAPAPPVPRAGASPLRAPDLPIPSATPAGPLPDATEWDRLSVPARRLELRLLSAEVRGLPAGPRRDALLAALEEPADGQTLARVSGWLAAERTRREQQATSQGRNRALQVALLVPLLVWFGLALINPWLEGSLASPRELVAPVLVLGLAGGFLASLARRAPATPWAAMAPLLGGALAALFGYLATLGGLFSFGPKGPAWTLGQAMLFGALSGAYLLRWERRGPPAG